jgi:hypothetical protein
VEVGEPLSYRTVTVFPLTLRGGENANVATLDQALAQKWLTIQEKETPSVPSLQIRNTGQRPVFLMTGEILLGGKQNRIVKEDVLLPAESGLVDVPVYCGEQHRWEDGKQAFRAAGSMAGGAVRGLAVRAAPQIEVWESIDAQLGAAKVEAPTRSYQAIYDDREATRVSSEAVERLRPRPLRETVGLVVFSRGGVVSADLFSDPELLAQLWNKIVQSHAVDEFIVRRPSEEKWEPPSRERVRAFLAQAAAAEMVSQSTPGSGEGLRVSGRVEGRALLWRSSVLHAALFPAGIPVIYPTPVPRPRPGPIPRPPIMPGPPMPMPME